MIPHSAPTINDRMIKAVAASIRTGQVSAGPQVAAFEKAFTLKFALPAAAVSSGTAALHLALAALGIGPRDEVVLPTYVCTALLNAINYVGAKPVLTDVDPVDGNITAAEVKKKMTRRTKAVLVPHMFGVPADMKALVALGVPLIEDCAQAVGAKVGGRLTGTMGRVSIFSFYATKMMTTGEGGMVVSSDKKLMGRVRDLLSYDHRPQYQVRFNYKMTDMQAALGLMQLEMLDAFISRRRKIAAYYDARLQEAGCVLPTQRAGVDPAYYRYVVRVRSAERAIAAMAKKDVACARPLFRTLHQYLKIKGFTAADRLMRENISLPLYPGLSDARAKIVADAFREVLGGAQ